jgi:hypothetical protein
MTVRSNPPGALVFVDDREIGITPVSTEFTYYGTRKLQLLKDGYEPVSAKQKFSLPWWQIFPLDFISENLCPFEIRDERYVDVEMLPQQIVPNEQLLERAQTLRMSNRHGHATPMWTAPADVPPGTTPLPSSPLPNTPTLAPPPSSTPRGGGPWEMLPNLPQG